MTVSVPAAFATDYDDLVEASPLPVSIATGVHQALQVVDQFHRGVKIAGRFVTNGLVAVKAKVESRPVRVRMQISADARTAPGWQTRGEDDEPAPFDVLPRLIQVRAQGRRRQCVVLSRRSRRTSPCAHVVFDLAPDEVPDDGLICLEVMDALEDLTTSAALRETVAGLVVDGGVAGLRIDRLSVEEWPEPLEAGEHLAGIAGERSSLVSGGGVPKRGKAGVQVISPGMLVLNPLLPGGFVCRLVAGPDPTVGSARLQSVVRNLIPPAAPRIHTIVGFQGDDPAGVESRVTGHALELEVPAGLAAPVLVVFEKGHGLVPTLMSVTPR